MLRQILYKREENRGNFFQCNIILNIFSCFLKIWLLFCEKVGLVNVIYLYPLSMVLWIYILVVTFDLYENAIHAIVETWLLYMENKLNCLTLEYFPLIRNEVMVHPACHKNNM
jgi:hypothetical protein